MSCSSGAKNGFPLLLKKLLFLPPVILGLALLFFFANQKDAPQRKAPEELARPARVIVAEPLDLVPRVLGYGSVRPSKVWNGVAQVSGEVVALHPDFKKGAIMAAGSEIVRISPSDYELAIAQAEANIRAAEARLEELSISAENTRANLKIEKRVLELRQAELARKTKLLERGTVAQAAVDQEMRDTLAQRKAVQDLENTLRLIPTQIAVQEEQKAVSSAELARAKLDLARTRITLPFPARIAEVNVEITQFVQAGQTLAVADGLDTAEIEAQVPISQFQSLVRAVAGDSMPEGILPETLGRIVRELGFAVTVRLGSGKDATTWSGRFARISDSVDPETRTIGVIAAVDDNYASARPGARPPLAKGLFVEVEISAKPLPDRLVIPRSALHDGTLLVMNAENRLEVRPVVPELFQGDIVAIAQGLAPGERVVVSDLVPVVEGMLLEAHEDEGLAATLRAKAGAAEPLK